MAGRGLVAGDQVVDVLHVVLQPYPLGALVRGLRDERRVLPAGVGLVAQRRLRDLDAREDVLRPELRRDARQQVLPARVPRPEGAVERPEVRDLPDQRAALVQQCLDGLDADALLDGLAGVHRMPPIIENVMAFTEPMSQGMSYSFWSATWNRATRRASWK